MKIKLHALVICFLAFSGIANAQFTTVINVPPDVAPEAIDSDTQLNLLEGGVISGTGVFSAGTPNGTSQNVELNIVGGQVDLLDVYAGTTLNMSSGTIGDFLAFDGSLLNISGGKVDRTATTLAGSVLNLSGGEFPIAISLGGQAMISGGMIGHALLEDDVFFTLQAAAGSDVDISGGTIRSSVIAFAESSVQITGGTIPFEVIARLDSNVRISGGAIGNATGPLTLAGGEFVVDGVVPTGQSVVGKRVHGVLQDGTPFVFGSNNDRELKLESIPLPPVDPKLIVVDSDVAPEGLRSGQSLTMVDGGKLPELFVAIGSSLSIRGGQAVVVHSVDTRVEISGGTIHGRLDLLEGSKAIVNGGEINLLRGPAAISNGNVEVAVISNGNLVISGGSIGRVQASSDGEIHIAGGEVAEFVSLFSGSSLTISGGKIGGNIRARSGTELELVGKDFLLHGEPIGGLDNTGDSVIISPGELSLTGTFVDGSPLAFEFSTDLIPDGSSLSLLEHDAILRLTLIPEPSSILLFALATGSVLFCRKRNVMHIFLIAAVFALASPAAHAQYQGAIDAWVTQDARNPPPDDAVLFIGSSSIRYWESLTRDFADYNVIQRGFGSARIPFLIQYVE